MPHGTAWQLFEAMQTSGFVSVDQVFDAWPGDADREQLMRLSKGTGQLAWPEFRAAVRLWRSLSTHRPPSLPRYLLQSMAEAVAGNLISLGAAEAACFAAANMCIDPAHLLNLGGFGALLAILPLDSSSMSPQLSEDSGPPALVNLGPSGRFCMYLLGAASLGVMLSPASTLLSATVGDPKSRGHGPLAVAALSCLHFLGFAATLCVLPCADYQGARSSNFCASLGGTLTTAALGLLAARVMERPGAQPAIMLASSALLLQSLGTSELALRSHLCGRPEPLRPVLGPALGSLACVKRTLMSEQS